MTKDPIAAKIISTAYKSSEFCSTHAKIRIAGSLYIRTGIVVFFANATTMMIMTM
jgi:hypothetical protein